MIKFKPDWPHKHKTSSIRQDHSQGIVLEGARVFLRPPMIRDYQSWCDVRARNKEFLTPYEPQWADDALSKNFYKRRLIRQNQEMLAGRGLFFLIFCKKTKTAIGGFNLNNIQYGAARSASLGYWLDEAMQGQGYIFEAAQLAVNYAFDTLKLHRLNAACLPHNHRSANLLLKLGFEEEGFAKRYLQINGDWQDHRLFGCINL